jgi:hypothetical protein
MAGIISTGNHPKDLWPGIKGWFGRQYREHKPEYTDCFTMMPSTNNYEEFVELTGFGLAPVKPETEGVHYDSETQGYVARLTHVAIALGYMVSREALDDGKYEVVSKRRARALAFSMRQTKENYAANVYNRGFNSSYVGGDGKELFAEDHPTTSGDQANELANPADISEDLIEDLCILVSGMTNNKGLKINLRPKVLLIHHSMEFEAARILRSANQNDTANNATNALRVLGKIPKVSANHYFTDEDATFLRTDCPDGMIGLQRVPVEFTQDNDFDTMAAKAKAYERYVFGWGDFRGCVGVEGA